MRLANDADAVPPIEQRTNSSETLLQSGLDDWNILPRFEKRGASAR